MPDTKVTPGELAVWDQYAAAALAGAMSSDSKAWKGAVENAAQAADALLTKRRERLLGQVGR
jgi:hypothetical protein